MNTYSSVQHAILALALVALCTSLIVSGVESVEARWAAADRSHVRAAWTHDPVLLPAVTVSAVRFWH